MGDKIARPGERGPRAGPPSGAGKEEQSYPIDRSIDRQDTSGGLTALQGAKTASLVDRSSGAAPCILQDRDNRTQRRRQPTQHTRKRSRPTDRQTKKPAFVRRSRLIPFRKAADDNGNDNDNRFKRQDTHTGAYFRGKGCSPAFFPDQACTPFPQKIVACLLPSVSNLPSYPPLSMPACLPACLPGGLRGLVSSLHSPRPRNEEPRRNGRVFAPPPRLSRSAQLLLRRRHRLLLLLRHVHPRHHRRRCQCLCWVVRHGPVQVPLPVLCLSRLPPPPPPPYVQKEQRGRVRCHRSCGHHWHWHRHSRRLGERAGSTREARRGWPGERRGELPPVNQQQHPKHKHPTTTPNKTNANTPFRAIPPYRVVSNGEGGGPTNGGGRGKPRPGKTGYCV